MALSEPFWQAAARGLLRLQWSTATDRPVQYPRIVSPYATRDELEWRDADPCATVIASTVVHRHSHAEFADQVPFGLALVEHANGARFTVRFDPVQRLAPGDAVTIALCGDPPVLYVSPSSR